MTTDEEIEATIAELERERESLHHKEEGDRGTEELAADRRRIREIEVELDRQWDWLRRRRAARRAGNDPDLVAARDAETVEDYLQ